MEAGTEVSVQTDAIEARNWSEILLHSLSDQKAHKNLLEYAKQVWTELFRSGSLFHWVMKLCGVTDLWYVWRKKANAYGKMTTISNILNKLQNLPANQK